MKTENAFLRFLPKAEMAILVIGITLLASCTPGPIFRSGRVDATPRSNVGSIYHPLTPGVSKSKAVDAWQPQGKKRTQ